MCTVQTHTKELQQVLDIVVSHQALELKCELVVRLLYALVAPRAEHFRPVLRRLAGLVGRPILVSAHDSNTCSQPFWPNWLGAH